MELYEDGICCVCLDYEHHYIQLCHEDSCKYYVCITCFDECVMRYSKYRCGCGRDIFRIPGISNENNSDSSDSDNPSRNNNTDSFSDSETVSISRNIFEDESNSGIDSS